LGGLQSRAGYSVAPDQEPLQSSSARSVFLRRVNDATGEVSNE
jgi:hypothetical protein